MSDDAQLLLAIDTSAGTSVAVVSGGRGILSQVDELDTMKHAEVIGDLIRRALKNARVEPAQLTGVVAGMGPGPFTGLRVGIAAARTFALGRGVDLLPVVSHDATALTAHQSGARGEVLVVSDARRREAYWSLYRLDVRVDRIDGPGLARPEDLPHSGAETITARRVSAGDLGLVALDLLSGGGAFPADQALYLRSPDVTVSNGAKRVSQ